VQRNDKNLRGGVRDMLCKWRLLLWRKDTTGDEGEVGGSSRIHLEKS
jgi:hypothetical protein